LLNNNEKHNLSASYAAKNEKQYLEELNRGSYNAFNALYKLYSARLYAFVFKMTKSHACTADIVQDVFIKIWLNRATISPDGAFQSYIFTIAKNRVIDKMRSNVNSPIFTDYVAYLNEKGCSEESVTKTLSYDDFVRALENAKNELSDTQRQIFELNKEQGFKNGEIAQMLQLSEQTVKNQLSIALKILRENMKNYSFLFFIFFLT
jgi:RNA polymerase sigma-70 factor (ECF subfamily)